MKESMSDGESPDIQKIGESGPSFRIERLSSQESLPLVIGMMDKEADSVARFSVGETIPTIVIKRDLIVDLRSKKERDRDMEIAKILAQIPLDDENLRESYPPCTTEPTADDIAHMAAITAGKARAVANESTTNIRTQKELNGWSKEILEKAGQIISKIGGKRGVAIGGSTVLAITTACSMATPTEPSKTPMQGITATPPRQLNSLSLPKLLQVRPRPLRLRPPFLP
jgi:hypothetical protein